MNILMKTKKIVTVGASAFILLLCVSLAHSSDIKINLHPRNIIKIEAVCVDGYKFVIAISPEGIKYDRPLSIVQMYGKRKAHLPPQPIKCDT